MKVYADNAATTVVSKEVVNAMLPCFTKIYGNPSSVHTIGQEAAIELENARSTIGKWLNAEPREIFFTSGGTEADNWAIQNAAAIGAKKNKRHIISSRFEHHAVLHTLNKLEKQGFEIQLLEVYNDGLVRPEDLQSALREDTALVTIMYANNEIGTVQPISQLGKICRDHGVIFHTDAVQAVGHVPIDVKEEFIDLLSLSAHKFHGPKGVGALYCRKGLPLNVFIEGGAQERGKRGGTENIPSIVGMAVALEQISRNMERNSDKVFALHNTLIEALSAIPRSRLNGSREKRLPGIVNFCFEGIEGEAMLLMLDALGICASSGSACTSGSLDPSHVLLALGLPHEIAHGSLRMSFSEYNNKEEVDYIIEKLPPIIQRLRSMSPVWEKIERGE
ncbi:MAG: cysteine desulfurase NifS [Syntrophomonadaceae bacterium]|nr:cysteine desulfurase NifS [Syntrophomonadaceae bacterium]